MAGNLHLHRKIDGPHSSVGRVLVRHIESGAILTITPIAGWHEHGDDWVTLAFADPSMKFEIVRHEIAPLDLREQVDPPNDQPLSYLDA